MWLMHELIEMEGEFVRSMGQFDRTLYPFYRADVESGRLNREQAKELIKFFWFKWYSRTRGKSNGKNFCFGGQYPDGSEITNDLTYLALEAYEELNTPDPKLSVRFLPDSPEKLYRRVADLVRNGHNSIVLMNDPPAVEALVKRGKSREDARYYLPIGCYEPAVEGKEIGCTMNLTVNLAKAVELALNQGRDPLSGKQVGPDTGDPRGFGGFEDLWHAYTDQMDYFLIRSSECIRAAENQWPMINPSPLVAATIDDCIDRGLDIGQGGAHYNSVGYVGAGLANAGDSLLAIKKAVFDEQRFSMAEIIEALRCNFEGEERMRQYLLNRVPKWGNNDDDADAMATRVADYYCKKVHTLKNARDGSCQAALFTLVFSMKGGQLTGALPDGRKAHESLAPGMGATYGRDRSGLTALLDSAAKVDATETPNGAVLDVTMHPSAVRGEEGLEAFVNLIKTFFSKGGYALQFNVFDVETLREAQKHPEQYASLQIRLTGWSVYFTTLSEAEQNQFIARTTHTV
jgi:formate C-acetyltransferase